MPRTIESSKQRYTQYREDLRQHRTEGTRRGAAAHNKTKPKDQRRSFGQLLFSLLALLRGQRVTLIAALCTAAIASAFALVPPAATKIVVDYILPGKAVPDSVMRIIPLPSSAGGKLAVIACGMILVSLISVGVGMWGRWQATRITKRVQSGVRRSAFDHAVRLPLHRIYALKSGGAASILREDAGSVADLVFSMIYNPWKAIVQLLGSLVILAIVDWRLLLGSLVLLPTVYLTHRSWIARIRPLFRDTRATRQGIDAHATEAFGGMRVVRAFGRQRTESLRFVRNNDLLIRQEILAWWWSRTVDIAWAILIPSATAGLLWYGGLRVMDGAMTVGDLIMFLYYLAMLLGPLALLAASATGFQNSLAGLDRVLDLLEEPREMQRSEGGRILNRARVRGDMTLRDVSFAYPRTKELVLRDINLDVEAGEMIGLVGPSGAGKTTLCNLVARFYDPTNGAITIDGVNLCEYDVESYRKLLGIVEQDIFLFDGTVAENIGYALRDATMDDIERVAQQANAHAFIERLPKSYDTLIGERGVRLSGGQRQRLAIARALLADPTILILDEATSNLDTESERLIQSSLETLMAGRTSFVIAHRLSTIMHADRIVVLEHGEIVESGTHHELMQRSGRYRDMVDLQTHVMPVAGVVETS